MEKLASCISEGRKVFFLVRSFLYRAITNEDLELESDRRETSLVFLAFFGVLGGLISARMLFPLLMILHPERVWIERSFILTLVMAVSGIVFSFAAENMYLSKEDHNILIPVLGNVKTLLRAKFWGMMGFVFFVTVSFHLLSTLVFTFFLSQSLHQNFIWFGFSHFFSSFLANLFVFLIVAIFQGIRMIFASCKIIDRLFMFFQGLLIVVFVFVLMVVPQLNIFFDLGVKETFWGKYFPPFWFAGLFETMTGSDDPFFGYHTLWALGSVMLLLAVYGLILMWGFRMNLKHIVSSPTRSRPTRWFSFLKNVFETLFFRLQHERAFGSFFITTMSRNRKVRIKLILILSFALGIVFSNLLYLKFNHIPLNLHQPGPQVIAFPIILILFLIVGIRIVVSNPVLPNAGWIFDSIQNGEPGSCIAGMKRGIYIFFVCPLVCITGAGLVFLWGPNVSVLLLMLFLMSISRILMEGFFFNFRRIPFVHESSSSQLNLKATWPVWLFSFILFVYVTKNAGFWLIRHPAYLAVFFLISLIIPGRIRELVDKKKSELNGNGNP